MMSLAPSGTKIKETPCSVPYSSLIVMLKLNLRCKLVLIISFCDTTNCHYEAMTFRIVDVLKSKAHPRTGTDTLYRPYGPYED